MVPRGLMLLLAVAGLLAVALLLLSGRESGVRVVPWVSADLDPPPGFVRSLEETTLDRARGTLAFLSKSTPEEMDRDTRYVWWNGTLKSKSGGTTNLSLLFALHQLGHILRLAPFIPGGEAVLSGARRLFLDITEHHGYMPGFDVGCAGPYALLGTLGSVLPADHPAAVNMTRGLLDLRVASGGWVNLDYSKANQTREERDLGPYVQAWIETTPPAILALRRAGHSPDDPAVRKAIRALDEAVLQDAYRDRYPDDFMLGNGWYLLGTKKTGITSVEAFRKARNEVAGELLANHSDTDRLYIQAIGLLGLQGYLPEGSEPYRAGLGAILRAYDPANHTWRANDSTAFGQGFFNTTSYNIAPLMALHRKGYGGDYLDPVTKPPAPACPLPEVAAARVPEGLRVRVRAPGAAGASVDYTTDNYRTLQNATLAPGEGGWFAETIPDGEFQVALQCGERFELTQWMSASGS